MNSRSMNAVRRILEDAGRGCGLAVKEVRNRYPAREVRRATIVKALRHFEDYGVVTAHGDHYRWVGPLSPEARPFGVPARRIHAAKRLTSAERIALAADLSEAALGLRGR